MREELDSGSSRTFRDTFDRFFIRVMEKGTSVIPVPSATNSVKDSMSPKFSGKLWIFGQPEMSKVFRDFTLQMLFGSLLSFLQFLRFSETSLLRLPIEKCTSANFMQPLSIKSSTFGRFKKLGVLVRNCE